MYIFHSSPLTAILLIMSLFTWEGINPNLLKAHSSLSVSGPIVGISQAGVALRWLSTPPTKEPISPEAVQELNLDKTQVDGLWHLGVPLDEQLQRQSVQPWRYSIYPLQHGAFLRLAMHVHNERRF